MCEMNPPVQSPVSLVQTTFTQIFYYVSVAVLVHNRKSNLKMNFKPCRSNNTEKRLGPRMLPVDGFSAETKEV